MSDSRKARVPILAAGGIVFREGSGPRIAIVRLRKDRSWVLPKGKICQGESALAAAKREVVEETGHQVSVHEFLGSMSYQVGDKVKIVQFWHMRAIGGRVRQLAYEIKAVKWLPLKQAIETLTRVHEKVFLANVGSAALKAVNRSVRDSGDQEEHRRRQSSIAPVEQSLAVSQSG
jgi:8-oxo-dGTP diphosphatase